MRIALTATVWFLTTTTLLGASGLVAHDDVDSSTRFGLVPAFAWERTPPAPSDGAWASARAVEVPRQRFAGLATTMDLIHVGASLAFALLHILLYAFFRRDPSNLYFAVFALGFAGMSWGGYRLDHADAAVARADLTGILRLTFTCGIVQSFALQRFAHLVFLRRTPLAFFLLLAWGVGVVVWVWLVPANELRIQPVMVLALATTAELLRTVAIAIRRPQPDGTWLIYVGLGALATAGAVQSLVALGVFYPTRHPIYAYGVLLFLLAVSIYLSRRFAVTARELERQLDEVQRLSEKTLAQEREARAREVEQRLLEAENDRRAKELDEARRLQLSMLPPTSPDVPGLDIAARTLTATEVGGDYYDFRTEPTGSTLAIGDATGHGLNAGIVVASTKSLFQGLGDDLDLAECLRRIDRGLRGMRLRRMAMSLCLARYVDGQLQVAAAGMPPILIHRRATDEIEECALASPPLGTFAKRTFAARTLPLARADTVLFATDGLVELLDPDDQMLGYSAVGEAFRAAAGSDATDSDAEHVLNRLLEAARAWSGARPLDDDLSLVVVRVA